MSASATRNQVGNIIVPWHGDATNSIEIDFLDSSYRSDHYVVKMQSWLANIYSGLTKKLTAIEKLVVESVTRDRVAIAAFPGLIV
jgi:hypothetical protein